MLGSRFKPGDYVRVKVEDSSTRYRKPHLRTPGMLVMLSQLGPTLLAMVMLKPRCWCELNTQSTCDCCCSRSGILALACTAMCCHMHIQELLALPAESDSPITKIKRRSWTSGSCRVPVWHGGAHQPALHRVC